MDVLRTLWDDFWSGESRTDKLRRQFRGLPPFKSSDVDDISVASFESGDEEVSNDREASDLVLVNNSIYKPLNREARQIRILKVAAATDTGEDIYCTLEFATLYDKPQSNPIYEALSYAWGNRREKRMIFVNGVPFAITRNLDVVLRYLRSRSHDRTLWIDAICIDQSNLSEKSHQVAFMRQIYSCASQVLVWLGESDRDTRKAMLFLQRMSEVQFPKRGRIDHFMPGLEKLFAKPWWSRMWVFQEVVTASKPPLVGCGRYWVDWRAFENAMYSLSFESLGSKRDIFCTKSTEFSLFAAMPKGWSSESERKGWPPSLKAFLLFTCHREAHIPHDKIIALLGLMPNNMTANLVPDYNQPYRFTFQDATVHILQTARSLNFLVEAMSEHKHNVPSWCVDFSRADWNNYTRKLAWSPTEEESGSSGKLPKSTIHHHRDQGTLGVSGLVVGQIKYFTKLSANPDAMQLWDFFQISERSLSDEQTATMSEIFERFVALVAKFTTNAKTFLERRLGTSKAQSRLASGEVWKAINKDVTFLDLLYVQTWKDSDKYQRITKLITKNLTFKQGYSLISDYAILDGFCQMYHSAYGDIAAQEWGASKPLLPDSPEIKEWVKRSLLKITIRAGDHSLIATDTGYLGLAPTAVKGVIEDDILVIIHGCNLPAIIRPGDRDYQLVTFAHVSDMMKGERVVNIRQAIQDSQRLLLY